MRVPSSPAHAVAPRAPALARASVEGLYQDPFWAARYGEARARRFGDEDARHHVDYLVRALEAGDPAVLAHYARWLQSVLVTRGMCSRHLARNFQGLGRALDAEGLGALPGVGEALAAALAALAPPAGSPARSVWDAQDALALAALARLGPAAVPEHVAARAREELLTWTSYLADALALGAPDTWVAHVRFLSGFWPQRGLDTLALRAGYAALTEALQTLDDSPARDACRAVLEAGARALPTEEPL